MKTSLRQNVIDYIRKTYQAEIEYLWMRYPEYGIFRHKDNQKWYALMMDVPRAKLGLKGYEIIDVLNVKLGDFFMRDFLIQREGFLPGYHISRGNRISILLDGTVELDEVCHLIDVSYQVTASAKTKQAIRPPKVLFRTLYAGKSVRYRQIQCPLALMEKDENRVRIHEAFS